MLLALHVVHCIYGLDSIWNPNTSDKNRVFLSSQKIRVEFPYNCCIPSSIMFAELPPSSLLYQFFERGDELTESPFSYKTLACIVLFPDGISFIRNELIFFFFSSPFLPLFLLLPGNWSNFRLFRNPVLFCSFQMNLPRRFQMNLPFWLSMLLHDFIQIRDEG